MLDRFCSDDCGDGPPPSVAVIVAHPDDEAIGVGARLKNLPESYVVHITEGAPASAEYARARGFATREEYAAARREEVEAALALAGVDEDRIINLGMVDGETHLHLESLSYAIALLLEELHPEIVVTHPYEGGHSDHDSTAFAVHLACGILRRRGEEAPVVLELTSYHSAGGQRQVGEFLSYNEAGTGTGARGRVEERIVELTPEMVRLKKEMYDQFESQRELLSTFPVKYERFRPAPRYVFTMPPHPGMLNYERATQGISGEEWRLRADRALERLRSKKRSA